ncbi:hypothetical protein LOK49_LG09G02181 [Camellia lanceoleosa]|uniref:Uncharacterized protein n=1 Tax=Camellia lanceoleosa TaxID=1840588 RepID=A0ACC0GNA3_9ERIC|nr:hypothetical protein LOK49_LG09G02181 [Camellia lanceoleosa]
MYSLRFPDSHFLTYKFPLHFLPFFQFSNLQTHIHLSASLSPLSYPFSMAEEFHESDVIFPESFLNSEDGNVEELGFSGHLNSRVIRNENPKRKKKKKKNSVPVNIPENVSGENSLFQLESDFFEDDEELVVPPHVVVGRRIFAGKMAFSVCTGNGRTLKGRDLSEVRNSILRMTGFLET